MSSETEASGSNRHVQSLVHICHRVAAQHIDLISSLGDLPYSLVQPILERCTAEQLLRVEAASPHLKKDSDELWKALIIDTYPAMADKCEDGSDGRPGFWRAQFFILREAEAKRLEEAASLLRSKKAKADEHKKKREIKVIDSMPPPKRQRTGSGWNTSPQPKTLFQKTKSEASKLQKNIYHTRMIPPMPKGNDYRLTGNISGSSKLPIPQSSYSSRVTVNTVTRRPSLKSTESLSESTEPTIPSSNTSTLPPFPSGTEGQPTSKEPVIPLSPPLAEKKKTFPISKKDPMSSLFVPKHRAYSQRTR
ncbi:RNA polymerase II transcription factor SIII subunit A-domain-containing protein [Rhodocollybia butyracea]|uniref:Elongin-A n=1 Tax=Rhodocollybia butyracea TaxID=206335 RepID=A0A9P5PCD5_9AGAR|nr:RNA polymerase II transcription factor SIII subunit A-domain-containing protein [Rhodocollybia butyracea]